MSKMQIFVNSERFIVSRQIMTGQELIALAGYPLNKLYIITDELNCINYSNFDRISLRSNMSIIIKER